MEEPLSFSNTTWDVIIVIKDGNALTADKIKKHFEEKPNILY
jgi:hypothetical protein